MPEQPEWPSVSIVVLNRDGAQHLRQMLRSLVERTDYPGALDLIVVDNASSDDSLELLRTVSSPFPISILANAHNESFSDACNQGARCAGGELLLFLNNDAEPFESGWLRELVVCLGESQAGAVGPTLLEPAPTLGWTGGYAVHQRGLWLRDRNGRLGPGYRDHGADPLGDGLGDTTEPFALAAACLLIERRTFERVGGFSHGYWYGPEDVDLALKLRRQGYRVACSGRSGLIHPPSSTLDAIPREQRGAWVRGNRRLFLERWGPQLFREYALDRLSGGGFWAEPEQMGAAPEGDRAKLEALGFCLMDAAEGGGGRAPDPLDSLCLELSALGHCCAVLRADAVDDLEGLEYDVAVHRGGRSRYALKPAQLNVLWLAKGDDRHDEAIQGRYDLVLREDGVGAEELVRAVRERAAEIDFPTRIEVSRPVEAAPAR